jgi:uncharacterized protein (DUF2267 family)
VKYGQMVKAVKQRADLADRDDAERTLWFVVQTLCDRLIGGEADDLLSQLPEPLKSEILVIQRADPMNPDEFVQRVAEELDVHENAARDRVRAVFATLHEAVTEGEWDEVVGQLDKKYASLIA